MNKKKSKYHYLYLKYQCESKYHNLYLKYQFDEKL